MYQYRITKYNPIHRDKNGTFTKEDWLAFSDVGKSFNGEILTLAEYERTEKAYIETAIAFLSEAQIPYINVNGVQNTKDVSKTVQDGMSIEISSLKKLFTDVLRERYWCRFEKDDEVFVHFGWDYYMYIGTKVYCGNAITFAYEKGLFVEELISPYHT